MMMTCNRFEEEGLETLLKGEPLDSHYDDCPACERARRDYDQLTSDLAALNRAAEPPDGWQAAVWREIRTNVPANDERPSRRRPIGRLVRYAVPATLAAGLAGWLVLAPHRVKPGLEVVVRHSQTQVFRSGAANPGDRMEIRAETGGREVALRVYDNQNRLYLDCTQDSACVVSEDEVRAELELDRRGSYHAFLFFSDEPIPDSTGDLDKDLEVALDLDVDFVKAEPVDVH